MTERNDVAADIPGCDGAHTDFTWTERCGHVGPPLFRAAAQALRSGKGGDPARRGPRVITTSRNPLGSIVLLLADASLSALSDRVHRGSLANARRALEDSRAAEAQSHAQLQAGLREFAAFAPPHRLAASG